MANLSEIKERITATSDTKKIASSLQLVAASKMKSYVRKALATRQYASGLLWTLSMLAQDIEELPFSKPNSTDNNSAFILVTSDKGLCGSLNQRLIRHLFDNPEWKNSLKNQRLLITIGRKGTETARHLGHKPVLAYPGIGEDLSPLKALKIIDEILELWNDGKFSKLSIVSPHYISPFISHPTLKTYLPFSLDMAISNLTWTTPDKTATASSPTPILEPNPERVATSIAFQIIQSLFTESFFELKASEYSSRMVAMKKATDSASDLITELTLDYNKARQAAITQQVSELASAVEATT